MRTIAVSSTIYIVYIYTIYILYIYTIYILYIYTIYIILYIFVKDVNNNNQLSLRGVSWVLPNLQMTTIQYYTIKR